MIVDICHTYRILTGVTHFGGYVIHLALVVIACAFLLYFACAWGLVLIAGIDVLLHGNGRKRTYRSIQTDD